MEEFPIEIITAAEHFPQLREIPQPPKKLYTRGSMELIKGTTLITVVGSRKFTPYGRHACESLIQGLRGYPITIVSGLAYGIDTIAHESALRAGLPTIAFPGSGLNWDAIYPAHNRPLAKRILAAGGMLISEFNHTMSGAPWSFPMRNRLEAGIATITIVIEAQEKSGTLITARLATEYNKIVGAVPGPINSPSSVGANWLLKLGAVPITESADILHELHFHLPGQLPLTSITLNEVEQKIFNLVSTPLSKETIITHLALDIITASIAFSTLEIKGLIKETYGLIDRT